MSSELVTPPASVVTSSLPRVLRIGLLSGLGLAALMTAIALLRYPGSAQQMPTTIIFAVGAFGVLLVLALWVVLRATHPKTPEAYQALRLGSRAGLAGGILWVLEIGFNNLLPAAISVPRRDTVDNIFWLLIVLIILIASAVGAARTKRLATGGAIGLWSGFISGLLACLAGLALVVFRIDLILSDPLAQAEYALRGPTSGVPDITTYFARDTMAGAFGHLTLLGIFMGLLLGVIGGGIGRLRARRIPRAIQAG